VGSGNIKVEGLIKAEKMQNAMIGSGSISLNVEATTYTVTVSGFGKINVNRKASNATVSRSR
jgi:Putative auto-transporter adhesin, head GIN domain